MKEPNRLPEGSRSTEPRRVILEELRRVRTHPTADELYAIVRRRLPRVSLGTVYRNLDFLCRAGLVLRLGNESAQMRFDGRVDEHQHIRCVSCGLVADLKLKSSRPDLGRAERTTDYLVLGVAVEYRGLCPECRRRRPAESHPIGAEQ